jgi:hypothetical protein
METTHKKQINSLKISTEKLNEFSNLFEQKTGKKLLGGVLLEHAETLLHTVSLLYKPVKKLDYYKADIAYPLLRKPLDNKT